MSPLGLEFHDNNVIFFLFYSRRYFEPRNSQKTRIFKFFRVIRVVRGLIKVMSQKISYCGELAKTQDPDRFLISLFAPENRQEALWALFAFNHEIAKTREVVSEATLGHIRLQWWRDALKGIYEDNNVVEHEVVKPLAAAIAAYDLPREEFDALMFAREFDLEGVAPGDIGGLLNYCDYTNAPLLRLAVQICGGEAQAEAVQPVAINYGLVGIIRAIVHHARQQRHFIPMAFLEAHNVSETELYALKKPEEMAVIVEALCDEFVSGVQSDEVILKASQKLSEIYYKQLKSLKYNIAQPRAFLPPFFKELRLAFSTKLL